MRPDRPERPALRKARLRLVAFLLGLASLLWLAGCLGDEGSVPRADGGTGSEAGDAYGRVMLDSATPVASATVTLYKDGEAPDGPPVPVATATTDSLGRYRFAAPAAGRYDVEYLYRECECRLAGHIRYRRDAAMGGRLDTDLGADTLAASATVKGRLPGAPPGMRVRLAGTPYAGSLDTAGRYLLERLPQGRWTLMSERDSGDTAIRAAIADLNLRPGEVLDLTPPDSVPVDTVPIDVPIDTVPVDTMPVKKPRWVEVDDFEDGDGVTLLGAKYGGGLWTTRSTTDGAIRPATGYIPSGISTSGAGEGRSLFFTYQTVGTAGGAVRAIMDVSSAWFTPTGADTLFIWARGYGRLLVSATWEYTGGVALKSREFDIDDVWRSYRFPITPVMVDPAAGTPVLKRVEFVPRMGNRFALDEIWIHGLRAAP